MQPEGAGNRLPCRGCTADCPDYERCDGKPWRLRVQLQESLSWAGLSAEGSSARNVGESLAV